MLNERWIFRHCRSFNQFQAGDGDEVFFCSFSSSSSSFVIDSFLLLCLSFTIHQCYRVLVSESESIASTTVLTFWEYYLTIRHLSQYSIPSFQSCSIFCHSLNVNLCNCAIVTICDMHTDWDYFHVIQNSIFLPVIATTFLHCMQKIASIAVCVRFFSFFLLFLFRLNFPFVDHLTDMRFSNNFIFICCGWDCL